MADIKGVISEPFARPWSNPVAMANVTVIPSSAGWPKEPSRASPTGFVLVH